MNVDVYSLKDKGINVTLPNTKQYNDLSFTSNEFDSPNGKCNLNKMTHNHTPSLLNFPITFWYNSYGLNLKIMSWNKSLRV